MIQRVQSVYMFLVLVLMSFLFFFPVATFMHQDGETLKLFGYGLKKLSDSGNNIILSTIPLIILIVVIGVLNLVNIFFYAKRTRQIRICIYNILLMVGLVLLFFYYYRYINNNIPVTSHVFKLTMVIPFVSIFLNLMAVKGIGADEMLVRSYERLRKK